MAECKSILELARANRSYRRFYEDVSVSQEDLTDLVAAARLAASAANKQPLRYRLVTNREECAKVFATLGWAGYLSNWDGPVEGERPAAYILMLGKEGVNSLWDEGIMAQTMLLAAVEKGLGGCMLGNVKRAELAASLSLPEGYAVKLVIAIGKPKEEIVIDDIRADGDIRYYREENQVHHVPKIVLEDLIL